MIDLTVIASWGLVVMAVWGDVTPLGNEHPGSTEINRAALQAEARREGLLITCPNGKEEALARALRLPDNTEVSMVEPIWFGDHCYDDHFIVKRPDGTLERWDVGYTERIMYTLGSVPRRNMTIQAMPRRIMDMDSLKTGNDGGGGVGSLIGQTPTTPMTVTMTPPL